MASMLLCIGAFGAGQVAVANAESSALLERLRGGGLVVFLRHTHTGQGSDVIRYDVTASGLADCSKQRDLDVVGETQATAVGRGLSNLGISFSEVLASPYCRTLKTARLAFPTQKVVVEDGLTSICQASGRDFDSRTARLRKLLSTRPGAGNRILVSHNCNIRALSKSLAMECARKPNVGDAIVFSPNGSQFELLGCVTRESMEAAAPQP
jgi:phosphohistidine phosphatase SixA